MAGSLSTTDGGRSGRSGRRNQHADRADNRALQCRYRQNGLFHCSGHWHDATDPGRKRRHSTNTVSNEVGHTFAADVATTCEMLRILNFFSSPR